MSDIVEEAIQALARGGHAARGWLLFVSEAMRKAWSPTMQTAFETLDERGVTSEEGGRLREALVRYYVATSDEPTRRECLRILARHGGGELKEDLLHQLHLLFEIHRSVAGDLSQILLALEDIGECVYPAHQQSHGLPDVQANVEAADQYLRNHGFKIPY